MCKVKLRVLGGVNHGLGGLGNREMEKGLGGDGVADCTVHGVPFSAALQEGAEMCGWSEWLRGCSLCESYRGGRREFCESGRWEGDTFLS